jgi:hypothetical protein
LSSLRGSLLNIISLNITASFSYTLCTNKAQPDLTEDAKKYIAKYEIIYRRVIREARRRENDKNILHADYKYGRMSVFELLCHFNERCTSTRIDQHSRHPVLSTNDEVTKKMCDI